MQEKTLAAARLLVAWYRKNARLLPWREEPTPYHVWLSEVMLQQTRVEAVRPYYARFLQKAPTIPALAALADDELMKLWEGLGYYSRARHLKAAATVVTDTYGGEMPDEYEKIRALPGVGDYTAGAIASIAFGRPTPAVDGNVLRVYSRLHLDPADVLQPATRRRVTGELAEVYAALAAGAPSSPDCAALTQGLMELGQTVCLPRAAARCSDCPLASLCAAREEGDPEKYPTRVAKTAKKRLHLAVFVLCDEAGRYAIRRRPEDGLLGGLWELPNAPITENGDPGAALAAFCRENRLTPAETATLPPARHVFTHLVWEMRGVFANVRHTPGTNSGLVWVTAEELGGRYALPSAFRAYRAPLVSGK